jgi:hypothetical protein
LLTIRSTSSNRTIQINEANGSSLSVELTGYPVTAVSEIWVETGDVFALMSFFIELGQLQSPWQGAKKWTSLEGDFCVSASCSSLGAVTFDIELCGLQGAPEEWRVKVGIESELGQLEQLARDAERLRDA